VRELKYGIGMDSWNDEEKEVRFQFQLAALAS
jgi:hypothetical protein